MRQRHDLEGCHTCQTLIDCVERNSMDHDSSQIDFPNIIHPTLLVLGCNQQHVTANFALRNGDLDAAKTEAIIKALAEVLPK